MTICENSERLSGINYFRKSSILDVWLSFECISGKNEAGYYKKKALELNSIEKREAFLIWISTERNSNSAILYKLKCQTIVIFGFLFPMNPSVNH